MGYYSEIRKNKLQIHEIRQSIIKNLPANAGDTGNEGLTPGSGRSLGVGNDNPLQYSCLENPCGQATVRGVTKSRT